MSNLISMIITHALVIQSEIFYSSYYTECGRETGDYKTNYYFKHYIYLNTVFELVTVVWVIIETTIVS
jgi:hypothetical protein